MGVLYRQPVSPREVILRYLVRRMRGAIAMGLAAQSAARLDTAAQVLRLGLPIDTVAPPRLQFDPGLMRRFALDLGRELPDLDEAIARFRETDAAPNREEVIQALQRVRDDSERLLAIVERDRYGVSIYQQEAAQEEVRRVFRSAVQAHELLRASTSEFKRTRRPDKPLGPIITYFRGIIDRAAGGVEDREVYERFGL